MSLNIPGKIHAFETCLNQWKRWKLSLIGKITVLNTKASISIKSFTKHISRHNLKYKIAMLQISVGRKAR